MWGRPFRNCQRFFASGGGASGSAEYKQRRLAWVAKERHEGRNPYVHHFATSHYVKALANDPRLQAILNGQRSEEPVSIAGRITNIREAGQKLCFYDLVNDGDRIQLCGVPNNAVRRGDIVGVNGVVGRTQKGELSVFFNAMEVLTPCLRMLPANNELDAETRYHQPVLDMLVNPAKRSNLILRRKIVSFLRNFLEERRFLEVDTPILHPIYGGASATPFVTRFESLKATRYLRISPELYLKRLLCGGFDRVYEIGPVFRNEDMDASHVPEFTMLEFYMAYADYNELMDITEELFCSLAQELTGSTTVIIGGHEVDFKPPWPRLRFIDEIEAAIGRSLPSDLKSPEAKVTLDALLREFDVDCSEPRSTERMLDKLCGRFVEGKIKSKPSFVIDHPEILSPLSKWHRDNPALTERFEVFINGIELCNAYTELNDSERQRQNFENMDNMDADYVEALEWGLPPCAGFGLGVDRLTLLLSQASNIKDVLFFPPSNRMM
eukprot:GEMP01018644.1.p1 GENE.GEMP01018644.1~~GEMP01018644.1.p1  ORF type:complete len:495 (+),score=93.59 GEMP01018644.1:71-1555(+)